MKTLSYLLLLVVGSSLAQVKGNKEIITKTYPMENVTEVSVQMYAKVIIDPTAQAGITITGEGNLLPLIGKQVSDGTLTLDQLEWIQPTTDIIIKIGAPDLKKLVHGTHDVTKVINLDQESFAVDAQIGSVVLAGKVDKLIINAKLGKVDAADLIAQDANIQISSRGSAVVNVVNVLDTQLDDDARLSLFSNPKRIDGNFKPKELTNKMEEPLVYVAFKLKNNSWNRNNFYVVGPNADGTSFSYGFPIMPGFTRAERWSVGTKVYLDKRIGKRELLYTVKAEDEGAVIDLFK